MTRSCPSSGVARSANETSSTAQHLEAVLREQLSILVDWIEFAIVTRGRGRVGVMPRRGVSRDLQIISG
jgi:hypothetical protein